MTNPAQRHGDDLTTRRLPNGQRERIEQITRLYLIVNGRPPDQSGLTTYLQSMQDGKTLQQLASEFVAADEFARRVRGKNAAYEICRTALGAAAVLPALDDQPAGLAALVTSLILSPHVQERLPVFPALYPDGVPLENPEDYRAWLSEKKWKTTFTDPASLQLSADNPLISFIVLLDRPNATWFVEMAKSVLNQTLPRAELLIVGRGLIPKVVRQWAARDPRLRLVGAPPWAGRSSRFNRAMAHCGGRFIGLISQHDQLCDTAIAELAAVTCNDSDLCLRIRAQGLRVIWSPYVRLLHLEQATRGSDETPERQIRFARERAIMRARWNGALDSDPFLNPNLLPSEAHPQPRLSVNWPACA